MIRVRTPRRSSSAGEICRPRKNTGAGRGDASVASHLPFPGATSSATRSAGTVFQRIPPPRRPWHPRGRRNAVTCVDAPLCTAIETGAGGCSEGAARFGPDGARNSPHTHPRAAPDVFRASRRRGATFHAADTGRHISRIPPFQLANPPVPARESGGSDAGAGGSASEATTSPRPTWPRRRSTRAACLPGAVRGGGPILDIDDRPRARQATSNRAPRRARMRSITATTSCPVGAPRSPARHFARWRGGARQGAHPLEGTLRQDLAQADYGAAR